MKEIMKNKKIMYILIALIIIIGIICTFALKLNYTLMYGEHTKIEVYLGKEYNLEDIKHIAKESLGEQEMIFQEIESFHDSVAINVREANDEQIKELETKLKEKYEIDENTEIIDTNTVTQLKGIDIVKPYIVPAIIVTIIILAYVGVRYFNLGALNVIYTTLLRLVCAEALLLSVTAILRFPIGAWTMPVAIFLYMIVVLFTTVQFENKLEK